MEDLDERWIKRGSGQQCEHDEKTPATLGLKNMAGVFILVAAGIVCGVGLIFIEIMYKRHQIRRQRRMELARHVTDKWRNMVEVCSLSLSCFVQLLYGITFYYSYYCYRLFSQPKIFQPRVLTFFILPYITSTSPQYVQNDPLKLYKKTFPFTS